MDPALREQLRVVPPGEEVEAAMLLQPGQPPPPLVRAVARLGDVVTCRIAAGDVPAVRCHPSVLSVKASRTFAAPETACAEAGNGDAAPRRRGVAGVAGRDVIMAFFDWGCDVAHRNFRTPDGRTRLLALWDQRASGGPPNRYGYGRIHSRADIDRALARPDPYAALGYHPGHSDPLGRGAHGTHVMDIAAGNGSLAGSAVGVAPRADLLFVQLAARTPARGDLGDSVRLLEAVDFVRHTAGARPWVINLSLGRTGGPHTGRSLVERALDAVLEEAPGRFIAQSCGNYLDRHLHAEGWLRPGGLAELDWHVEPADLTPNELEVWYPGCDRFEVELEAPGGGGFRAALGETAVISIEGREVGRLHHRADDPLTRDHHVDAFLYPGAPHGRWQVRLRALDATDGRYHAWIERDVSQRAQSSFAPEHACATGTLGTIATGFRTTAVGAVDCATGRLAPFTSHGPTRDGRRKPDLVAPGVAVLAARSTPEGEPAGSGGLLRLSGTSMAAPHVAGAAALVFEAAGRALHIAETRALLLGTADHDERLDPMGAGAGVLNVAAAVAAARMMERGTEMSSTSEHQALDRVLDEMRSAGHSPATLYRHLAAGGPAPIDGLQVIAGPGQRASRPPRPQDLLLRVAPGEPGRGHVAMLTDGRLIAQRDLAARAVAHETPLPGWYALVREPGGLGSARPFARRLAGPQGVLPPGHMLLALAEEDWGETTPSCFDDEEVQHTWRMVMWLHQQAKKSWADMQDNPMVIEVQMIEELTKILKMSRDLPTKTWGEVWDELKAFASCDVKPLVARVKKGEKHANAVLRVLHGLTSILQGYAHDRIDASFKSKLEAQKGWKKVVAQVLVRAIKKQIPVIQREISAGNFAAVATALEDLKKVVTDEGLSATAVWDVVVALGKEIIGNAIEDAAKNTALWVAKKVAKKLLGSAARAASVLFLIEEIATGLEAVYLTLTHRERLFQYNRMLLRFLERTRSVCNVARPGTNKFWVKWKRAIARIDCRFVMFSFDAKKGGDPGDGEWKEAALKGTFGGKTAETLRIEGLAGASLPGRRDMTFDLPPLSAWPAKGASFVGMQYTTYDSAGAELETKGMFVGACVTA